MSEASGGGDSPWQCRHCHKEFVVPKGVVFSFCPACRAPAEGPESDFEAVYCVNPECRTKLFHPTQKLCHECGSIQAQQTPQPPDVQAASTPTVHIASVSPSTSPDVPKVSHPAPTDTTIKAQHYEGIEKAVKAQRNLATSKHEDNQKDGVPYHVSTLPQHIPPTQQMAQIQRATGTIQTVPPTMSPELQNYQAHHVPAVNLPPHSQLVYPQAQQPGTEYPRVFGPPDDPQKWQQGSPNSASQPSIQCQAPVNQVTQTASQRSQVAPSQLPSQPTDKPQPTDDPQHKVLKPWPPMASSPTLSDEIPSSDSQPEQPPSPPSSQPNQGTNIPMTSSHTSLISQSSTVVSSSAAVSTVSSISHVSASKQDSSSQLDPHQTSANAKELPLNRQPLHDEKKKMDQEKEKEKVKEKEKKREKSHEKSEEARKNDKGKEAAQEPHPVVKIADNDPLQTHSSDKQSDTHVNGKTASPHPSSRKRSAERTGDKPDSPPKQQRLENLDTGSSQTTEGQPKQGTRNQQQENSGHPPQNSSTYGAERRASDQGASNETVYRKPENPEELFSGTKKGQASVRSDPMPTASKSKPLPKRPPNRIPKGLQAKRSITVTFHVLVNLPAWEWDDSTTMYIRFGHPDLGRWEYDCGPMEMRRSLDEDHSEMIYTLQIGAELLDRSKWDFLMPHYKYTVFSPKAEKEEDCYEYLHDYTGIANRCLTIPNEKYWLLATQGGTFHQYDTIAYPRQVKVKKVFSERVKRFFWGTVGAVRDAFTGGKQSSTRSIEDGKEEVFKPLNLKEMCSACLPAYLQDHHALLSKCNFPENFSIPEIVEEMHCLYSSLRYPPSVHDEHTAPLSRPQQDIPQNMKKWLESILERLNEAPDDGSGKRLVSALTIAYCFYWLSIPHPKLDLFAVPLLRMLQLKPNTETKRCPDYDLLCSVLPKEKRGYAADAIANLAIHLRKQRRFKNLEWLTVIPLYDFLKEHSQPFARLEMNPERIYWVGDRERKLELLELRGKAEPGFLRAHFEEFRPLFTADPPLLRTLIYLVPQEDIPAMLTQISPYLATSWFAFRVWEYGKMALNWNEAKDWTMWLKQLTKIVAQHSHYDNEPLGLFSLVDASLLLYQRQSAILKSQDHHLTVLQASICLLLFAFSRLNVLCPDGEKSHKDKKIKEAFGKLETILWQWITNHGVIGGSLFGGSISFWRGELELQLWQGLLSVECPPDPYITEQWHKIIRAHVQKRAFEIPDTRKIDLVCLLEYREAHPILTEVLMETATKAIDNISSKPSGYREKEFEKLAATGSKRVGNLLGNMLKKQYTNLHPETEDLFISLDELLLWNLWPNFIKIYESKSKLKEGLPRECQVACVCALSKLHEICGQIQNGDITIKVLHKIKSNEGQMKRLCAAATPQDEQAKLTFNAVSNALHQRLEEFQTFERNKDRLFHLCSQLDGGIQGLPELQQELQKNFNSIKINTLCRRAQSGEVQLLCFQSASTLNAFAENFFVMTQTYVNDLFHQAWMSAMDVAVKASTLTIADIHTNVWQPAFDHCQNLLDQLHDQSMKLVDVDKIFKHYRGQQLESQLMTLFTGVNACSDVKGEKNGTFIKSAVRRMNKYWDLCKYRDAANMFLELRSVLNLKGDFRNVERLSTEVTTSMKDQTLATVSDDLIRTGEFLVDVTSNPGKLQCLKTFGKCQEVIRWIQEVTKNVSDLQNFVNVALATAAGGEDDFAHDRLSDLRTVGSGFGSLIYNLPKTSGYRELSQRCTFLWESLENNPLLSKKLEGCNDALHWYKSVKETQGSVEVTSFGKMEHILRYGCYRVGSMSGRAVHSIHDVIDLHLEGTERQLPKMMYTLDDLRDLESKLVLITGSKAENRKDVDKFLNTLHSVCRIAEVLIALQQAGNVKYTGWVLSFSCETDSFSELQTLARQMETELQKWRDEVKKAREAFYELNYYRTLQLLSLRSELGKLKTSSRGHVIDPTVLALLHSISPEIAVSDIREVVQNALLQQGDQFGQTDASLVSTVLEHEMEVGESSSSMAADILASVDTHAAVPPPSDVPQAKLTQEELSDIQKEIFANLVGYGGFHPQLALIALEKYKEDHYETRNWCMENAGSFDFPEEEDQKDMRLGDQELESDESESEDERFPTPIAAEISPRVKSKVPPISQDSSPHLSITMRQTIDESHADVKSLMELDFTAEQSVMAIQRCGNFSEAMDYLMSGDQGGVFQPTSSQGGVAQELRRKPSPRYAGQSPEEGFVIYCDEDAEMKYLSLIELGLVLHELSNLPTAVPSKRTFPKILKSGQPNLLVTSPENVLRTALSLYMEDEDLPLPTLEEVLVCYSNTTAEEVTLLWQRAIEDPHFKRIFCLVHAEKLSYQVCDKTLRALTELSHGKAEYRLVIICSNEDEEKSHIVSKLQLSRKQYTTFTDTSKFQRYLRSHFTHTVETDSQQQYSAAMAASVVDCENSRVRVVSSTRSGMGKSLFIKRMTDHLQQQRRTMSTAACVTIPIHGPTVSPDVVLEFLNPHTTNSHCTIFHFDIAPGVLWEVDRILFSLLILRGLSDGKGRIWRCHQSQLYAVEVTLPETQDPPQGGTTLPESRTLALLDLLPSVKCINPRQALELLEAGKEDPGQILMDLGEFRSATFQRVYQYLRRHLGGINLDTFSYLGTVEGSPADCLKIVLHFCGIINPSWSEVHHFVRFLDLQLESCEESVFCDEAFVADVMAGLKSFVVKFMIRMSRDFATSSLQGEVARENEEVDMGGGGDLRQYEIDRRRRWEQSSHPYIFFNQDGTSITFVGFMVTQNGDLIDPAHRGILEAAIVTKQLYTGLKQNRVNFDEDYRHWKKDTMIEKVGTVMGLEFIYDPDPTYVLTVDNLIKILAIQMRFRCGIPVVIMGETGCGKTRLIRYMCDLAKQGIQDRKNMLIIKIHGGITEKDVIKFIKRAEEQAEENRRHNLDTVVFFDEANTTGAIGLIKEVMCDRRLNGRPVSPDLKFIAACNPYRKHTEDMIKKLESAGLGFYVRDTQQRLGQIPLRQLVYRVLDLPPSMRPLVYDFGQLNTGTESDYTRQIVSDHVKKHGGIPQQCIAPIAKVLAWSQKYMRDRQDECSFVSLRDVERAMIVLEYFFDKMAVFKQHMDWKAAQVALESDEDPQIPLANPNDAARSLILALSVCYHARLQERWQYEAGVAQQFTPPLHLPGGAEQFRNEIKWCQEVLLDNMTLGPNIARNAALRENIFMMAVCIELRIPLFLVGKPGSSKSLAKSIVASSMQGQASNSDLLKGFKQVHMFSYQCSQLSTPESVIEVFSTAKRFQKDQDTTKYVSVVVLDEVGLAEDSPNLPLKALHPLLEDGTEGADDSQLVIDREKRVAFIGISNWALDPAKMNRGVMVTRGDPDVQELELSARGICSYKVNDPVKERLKGYFQPLAEAYKAICTQQEREFFGLRDFYSLIKMLYWLCERSDRPPTWPQLEHAIRRNFGGLDDENFDPLEEFKKKIPNREDPDLTHIPPDLRDVVKPDSSPLGLITTSLRTKETTWHGESRYLLFLTENYAALEILNHYLRDVVSPASPTDPARETERRPEDLHPFILFGSSFPKDKEYTQVCRNINQIKICMETGRTVILLNLENLYESLYDVLNQYYIYHGGSRYVDLGLQTHRVKCRVHENFKLILIAEKSTVYEKFPTPLINRLEKHFVLTSSVLVDWQQEVLERLQEWTRQFSCVSRFNQGSAFIGYQKDTAAAVVFQATIQLQSIMKRKHFEKWEGLKQASILGNIQLDELMEEENSDSWKQVVFQLSQCLLLQTASPDAFVRLENTPLADQQAVLLRLYNEIQHHASLEDFLEHHLNQRGLQGGLLLQVTTHSHLLSGEEVEQLGDALGYGDCISWFLLQEFDTELDFFNKVSPAFQREVSDSRDFLLIIQCDSGHLDGDLIACARYRIYDEGVKSMKQNSILECEGNTHVLFVIHLPQQSVGSSFVGFQGDPWVSAHIDDLRRMDSDTVTLSEAMNKPISHLFISPDSECEVPHESEQTPMEIAKAMGEMQVAETPHDENQDTTEDLFETELSTHHTHSSEMEDQEMPPLEGPSEEGSLEEVPPLETSLDHMTLESMDSEQNQVPEKSDDEISEPEATEHIIEPAEPMMESSTAEQLSNQQTAQPHVQPKLKSLKKSGYYLRLHGCIQAAASRLQDSAKNKERATDRVKLLVNLIPRSPAINLDESTFHGTLVMHIYQLLKEREKIREDEKKWVLREALSAKKLQSGGTFRNVIARKLDEVIIPIFAEIIALIDHNYNLDLVDPKSHNTPVAQFWLAMFRDPKVMQFSFAEMSVREQVPGVGGRMAEEEFRCQLPFSWLVREAFEAQWDSAKSVAGNKTAVLYTQLYTLVSETSIGGVLESTSDINCEEFFQRYLHDFVRSVHKCNHKISNHTDVEYRLIEKALSGLVHCTEDFVSMDGHESLTRRIAAVHVIHHAYQSHLLWFGQLASYMPGVLVTLEQRVPANCKEMLLPLYAVKRALEMLRPQDPLKKDELALRDWLNQLRLSQNAIESILNLPSEHETAGKARLQWQLIRALQMFVEHIVLKYEGMEVYARRLEMYLMHDPDFLKASTLNKMKKHLNLMDSELEKKKLKGKPKRLTSIRRSCRAFFMELVSTLCFGGREPPEEELIQMLVNTVFTERQEMEAEELGTREFSYRPSGRDQIPVIRSFLLQLLLEHNTELVKAQLGDYFRRSQEAVATEETADRDLYLLCTQCFEDALYKKSVSKSFTERLTDATNYLKEGHFAFTFSAQGTVSLDFLEGVAKVRYGLSVVAELLSKRVSGLEVATQPAASKHYHGVLANQLLHAARDLCIDESINHIDVTGDSDTNGPIVYVLKLLMRKYGTDCLQRVSKDHQWVVPPELRQGEEEKQIRDPFILYGQFYAGLRNTITQAAIGKHFEPILEASEDLIPLEAPLLLLALYEKVTMSHSSTLPSKQLLPDVLGELVEVLAGCKVLSRELQWIGRALLANEQGGPLAQLRVIPRQPPLHQTLGAVVIHAAAVLLCRQRVDVLQPFTNMFNNPAVLANVYLPTMPEDSLPEVQRAGGAFYVCPRGHPYLVTECGRPVMEYTCNVCGSKIGGTNHTLLHDNRQARRTDETQTGHCLGQPEGRSTVAASERSLSPAACCILRALMHSALLWASCNNQTATEGLLGLVKPRLPSAQQLPEFFWRHLERDLQILGQATGKSVDEAAIIMHLVLRGILTVDPPRSGTVGVVNTLGARNARQEWEKIFNQVYIQPVLEKVDETVTKALDCIINDDNQEQDQLFYLVYEKVRVTEGNLIPHLWTYRSQITLEHLGQTLQQHGKKDKCPILYHFLQKEHNLRAIQYLPDIVRLQQRLYDSFHHRLDRREATHITIGEFLSGRKSENVRNEYQGMVESLQKAWQLVGDQLRDHARLRVEDAHLLPAIRETTPLEYLIPTTTGAGACTTALVDFLVQVHNSFIERCRGIVTEQEKSKSKVAWQSNPVPLPHIHGCHLLNYERQLPSIILSHCQYSLEVGKGQDVSYDWPALEKDILGRFIHGKPLIQSDIPQVVYRKDIYTAATFAAVRKKVEPQIELDSRVQQEIVQELRSVNRIRDALDVVDIVMGFLSSGGGKADRQLGEYITRALRMKKRFFSEKAREHCTLGHILSLWETLSVELARQLILSGQDPFDSVKDEFSKELISEGEESQTTALDHCLRSFNLDHLLGTLYEFIETHVKHCPDNESSWPLVDTLDAFLEHNNLPPIPRFAEEFPDSITLDQTVAVWKHTIQYQDRQKREGQA